MTGTELYLRFERFEQELQEPETEPETETEPEKEWMLEKGLDPGPELNLELDGHRLARMSGSHEFLQTMASSGDWVRVVHLQSQCAAGGLWQTKNC